MELIPGIVLIFTNAQSSISHTKSIKHMFG